MYRMSGLFIDDGFTLTKSIPAVPGLHPAVEVVFRPALDRKRHEYRQAFAGDPVKFDAWITELLTAQIVKANGEPLPKGGAAKLVPTIRSQLLDLVLGFAPADEPVDAGAELGNSR